MAVKNNYPIKYCVMGLEEFSHYSVGLNELEPVKEVYAYIAVKCYLVSETKIYNQSGSFTMSYGVVPSWRQDMYKDNVPEFNWNGVCVNGETVKYVFDDVKEAKRYARQLNYELCEELLSSCSVTRHDEYAKELQYKLQKAYKIEEEHLKDNNQKVKNNCIG